MPRTDTSAPPQSEGGDLDQMFTRKEAAAFLGFSVSTLKRWDREGILTSRRSHEKGLPRYTRADLLAAMRKRDAA